jgi:hypothetical protein
MGAGTTSRVGAGRGVARAVVRGRWWPRRACRPRRETPRAQSGVAEACRRGGMAASGGSLRWRPTAGPVCGRAGGDRDVGRGRAGNTPGGDCPRGPSARHRGRVRAARGPARSWPPGPWRPRPSIRWASLSESGRGVPSRRRRPHASSRRRHRRAGGCLTQARRSRTSRGLHTTGRGWICRGRTRSKPGHGRGRVSAAQNRLPSRWRRQVRAATVCAVRPERHDWRSASSRRWSGGRRESCARWCTAATAHGGVVGASPRRCRSARRRRRRGVMAIPLCVWHRLRRPPSTRPGREMAAHREGRANGRPNVGGTTQQATAQRFRSTMIRLPNGFVKHCTVLQANSSPPEAVHPSKPPAF